MKQHRMFWTLLVALMVASLVLAACGGGQAAPAARSPVPTEAAPAPEPTKAPEAQPAEPTKAPEAAPAEEGGAMMGPDGRASYAGLDKDLTGQTIRMANIGGAPYEAMYDSDQAVRGEDRRQGGDGLPGRRLRDRPLPEGQPTPPIPWTSTWPGTTPPSWASTRTSWRI